MEILIRLLAFIGLAVVIAAMLWVYVQIMNNRSSKKSHWGPEGNWYLGGKPKEVNERIRE